VSPIRLGSREDWWEGFPPFDTGSDAISIPGRKMPDRLNISNTQTAYSKGGFFTDLPPWESGDRKGMFQETLSLNSQ